MDEWNKTCNSSSQWFHHIREGPGSEGLCHTGGIDETGNLDLSGLGDLSEKDAEYLEISEVNKITIPKEVLQVHGFAPPKKQREQ
jgi:hypothetical protein